MPLRIVGVFGIWFFGAVIGAATVAANSNGGASGRPTATMTVPAFVTSTEVVTVAATDDPASAAAGPTAAGAGFDGDGTYAIPDDVKPGTYRAGRPDSSCYWARLKDAGGGMDSIIANGNSAGPLTITIRKTDGAIEVNGCGRFTRVR